MRNTFMIYNAELYDAMFDFFGEPPPCEECLVKTMCFSWKRVDSNILITLNDTCEEAKNWFQNFLKLEFDIFAKSLKLDNGPNYLSTEDINKIIDNWKESNEKLESEIKLEYHQ